MPEFKWPFILEHPAEFSEGQWLVVRGIGFALVLWIIVKFIVPMFKGILDTRQAAIVEAATQVETTLRDTQEMRNDYRERLAQIEDETRRRLADAEREAEDLRERILAEARQNAAALARRGEDEVARERAKAMLHLRTQFVKGVIGAAKHAAAGSLDTTHQRRLVDDFVKDLGAKS